MPDPPSPTPPDFVDWDKEFSNLQVDDYVQNDQREGYFTRPELCEHFGCQPNSSRFGTLLKQLKDQGRLLSRRTYRMDASGRRFPLKAFKILPKPSLGPTPAEMKEIEEVAKKFYDFPGRSSHLPDEPIVGSTPQRLGDTLITTTPAPHVLHNTPSPEDIPCPTPPSQPPSSPTPSPTSLSNPSA